VNGVDDLDALERELGPSLRVALRRIAAEITVDGPTSSAWTSDQDPASRSAVDNVILVDLESSTRASSPRERRRPRVVAAAVLSAAVVVAIATLALIGLDRDDPSDRTAETVADSFMKGWVGGDGQAVAALLSPGGAVDAWTAESLPALHDWYRAIGGRYQDDGCEVMSRGRVWCDYTVENDLTRAFGREPAAGSFVLVIDGEAVTSVSDLGVGAYRDIWTAFGDWVREHHPDDLDRMFTFAAGDPRVDPISIDLWGRYTREFVDSGDAYMARARAICTEAHDRYDGLVAASTPTEETKSEVAARVLEEALAELHVVPPPPAVQAPFDRGFSLIQQLVDSLRGSTPAGPPSAAGGDLITPLAGLAHGQIGLERCAIDPST